MKKIQAKNEDLFDKISISVNIIIQTKQIKIKYEFELQLAHGSILLCRKTRFFFVFFEFESSTNSSRASGEFVLDLNSKKVEI